MNGRNIINIHHRQHDVRTRQLKKKIHILIYIIEGIEEIV